MQTGNRVILMGVAGSGKSAVMRELAAFFKAPCIDGDDLHPKANIKKMAAGIPLGESDRHLWLNILKKRIDEMCRCHPLVFAACSALQLSGRELLRTKSGTILFLHLSGSKGMILKRMRGREGHFFKPRLLDSQFAALEPPAAKEEDVVPIDISGTLKETAEKGQKAVREFLTNKAE